MEKVRQKMNTKWIVKKGRKRQNMYCKTATNVILEAVTDRRQSLEKKIDVIDKTNKDAIDKMQTQFDNIRSEFNQRMEGLSKKVETRIKKDDGHRNRP